VCLPGHCWGQASGEAHCLTAESRRTVAVAVLHLDAICIDEAGHPISAGDFVEVFKQSYLALYVNRVGLPVQV